MSARGSDGLTGPPVHTYNFGWRIIIKHFLLFDWAVGYTKKIGSFLGACTYDGHHNIGSQSEQLKNTLIINAAESWEFK